MPRIYTKKLDEREKLTPNMYIQPGYIKIYESSEEFNKNLNQRINHMLKSLEENISSLRGSSRKDYYDLIRSATTLDYNSKKLNEPTYTGLDNIDRATNRFLADRISELLENRMEDKRITGDNIRDCIHNQSIITDYKHDLVNSMSTEDIDLGELAFNPREIKLKTLKDEETGERTSFFRDILRYRESSNTLLGLDNVENGDGFNEGSPNLYLISVNEDVERDSIDEKCNKLDEKDLGDIDFDDLDSL